MVVQIAKHKKEIYRRKEYDILRLFSAVSVIYIHISATAIVNFADYSWLLILNKFSRFSVPAFAFLTGVLVWGGQTHSPRSVSYLHFIGQKAKRIILPYIAWSAIYIGLSMLMNINAMIGLSVKQLAKQLVLGTSWYHLYFVPTIFTFYLLTPIAIRLKRLTKIMIASGWVISALFSYFFSVINPPWSIKLLDNIFIFIPYVFLGLWYTVHKERINEILLKIWPALILLGLSTNYIQSILRLGESSEFSHRLIYPGHIISIILAVLGMSIFLSTKSKILDRISSSFSNYAFGVYLSHPFFIAILDLIVKKYNLLYLWRRPEFIIISNFSILFLSVTFIWSLQKVKEAALSFNKRIIEHPVIEGKFINNQSDNPEIN